MLGFSPIPMLGFCPIQPPPHSFLKTYMLRENEEAEDMDASNRALVPPKNFYCSFPSSERLWRSKSVPNNGIDFENWGLSPSNCQCLEAVNAQNQLRNERDSRKKLECAMGRVSSAVSPGHKYFTTQTISLIDEINFLEREVEDLEKYILSQYRQIFKSFLVKKSSSIFHSKKRDVYSVCQEIASRQKKQLRNEDQNEFEKIFYEEKLQLSFTQHQFNDSKGCKVPKTTAPNIQSNSRQAYNFFENANSEGAPGISKSQDFPCLKELKEIPLRSKVFTKSNDNPRLLKEYLREDPNKLSEDLVSCMAAIYCKISEPPLLQSSMQESLSSSTSSSSNVSVFPGVLSNGSNPGSISVFPYIDVCLSDPFQVKGRKGHVGAYSLMIEVPWISEGKHRPVCVSQMLRRFRAMVHQLEDVDVSKMKHNEKLAFWINVYNALLMHSHLSNGIPRNNLRLRSILQKASYKVGGSSVNAYAIAHCILGCKSYHPSQWLQNLLLSASKLKAGDERRAYALETSDPRVYFALCCGSRSDPAVRVYTPKNIHEELETAKIDFLQASIGFHKDKKKVFLPKALDWYAQDMSMSSRNLLEWVCQNVGEKESENIQRHIQPKLNKSLSHCVEWLPYTLSFRYIFDRALLLRNTSYFQP